MNLAVKLYEKMPADDENIVNGIDGKIPAQVIFGIDTPPDENYTIMSEEQYQDYLASISAELETWKSIQKTIIEEE